MYSPKITKIKAETVRASAILLAALQATNVVPNTETANDVSAMHFLDNQ